MTHFLDACDVAGAMAERSASDQAGGRVYRAGWEGESLLPAREPRCDRPAAGRGCCRGHCQQEVPSRSLRVHFEFSEAPSGVRELARPERTRNARKSYAGKPADNGASKLTHSTSAPT